MGHTEPSPSVRYREHSNSIARKTSSSSTKTNDRTASESKPLYKEEFTQTEDSDTTRSNSIPKSSAKTGVQGGSMNMRFKNLVGSKRKSSAGNPSPAIDAATLRIPPAYAFAPSPLIAPRERLAHNPSPPMIVHDTSNDKYHSYTPSLAPQQANWTQDMISTTESYEPGTGQGRDPAIVREGGTESVMDTSEERSNGENEVDQLLRDWTNISHKNRSTAAGI